jgi:hypothetical protein
MKSPVRNAALAACVAVAMRGAPVFAQTVIDFETWGSGSPTTAGTAIGVDDFAAYGVHITGNAWIGQCGGGCPDPINGHFMQSHSYQAGATLTFDGTIDALDFWVPTYSTGTASAYDALGNLIGSVFFPMDFNVDHYLLSGPDISQIIITSDGFYGLDQLSYTLTPAAASPLPEPASWALMIGGFAMIGASMRRRRLTAAPAD